ncbi:hypothetical protein HDK90DRAFT_494058 [Phyllosticta capitalensis]|uniref:Uncharacterized protein n=1 Tax=Phyllosticta capitalensis TaxID=121624 RepID=A0ABR1YDN6_9PEZI
MALPTSFNARCLIQRLGTAIDAVEAHPRFDTTDPRRSHYSLHCLWDFLQRTRFQLSQIDLQRLDARNTEALQQWDENFGRAQMACPLMSEPTGFMLQTVMGSPNQAPLDLGDRIQRTGALLMPDPNTRRYTENPSDQQGVKEGINLDEIFGFSVRDTLTDADKADKGSSEGEEEDGATDSAREDKGPEVPPTDRSPFMEMPREIREEIYGYLVVADRTKESYTAGLPRLPKWGLFTEILCVNRQIQEEALGVLRRQNKFVVVERATRKLKSTPQDRHEEFPDSPIWIGRAKPEAKKIPGEVMRIHFAENSNAVVDPKSIDYFILLVEELDLLCINLSRFVTGGMYRTNGMVCTIQVAPPPESEPKVVALRREEALLNPVSRLRAFAKVDIQGASSAKAKSTVMQMKRREQTSIEAVKTCFHVLRNAEAYHRIGRFEASLTYAVWGTFLFNFYASELFPREMKSQPLSTPIMMRLFLQQALNSLHIGDYEGALEYGDEGVRFARVAGRVPEWREYPRMAEQGHVVKRGEFMNWATTTTLDRLKMGPNNGAITPVDVAQAFWYRAMAMYLMDKGGITEETDRMFCISLLDCAGKVDVANELLSLSEDLEEKLENTTAADFLNPSAFKEPARLPDGPARLPDGSFPPTDIPSYNIRTWERSYPPPRKPKNPVTDGGATFLLSRVNPMKGAPFRYGGERYREL